MRLFVLAGAFALALAAPPAPPAPDSAPALAPSSKVLNARQGFTVSQVGKRPPRYRSGSQLTANVYRKYGLDVPTEVEEACSKQSGSVIAVPEDEYDNAYLSPVTIGGQTLQLDIDTGSADLWVYSTNLSTLTQGGHDVYNPALSTTAALLNGSRWSISYGDGTSASGIVYTDTVSVGGVTVVSQAVGVATRLSASFASDDNLDGLLGLAFNDLNTVRPTKQNTFYDNIKPYLPQPVFAVDLRYRAAGSYDFGFVDREKYTGKLTAVAVDASEGFWGFESEGFAVGEVDGGSGGSWGSSPLPPLNTSVPFSGIVDTGTTLNYVPRGIARAYYAAVAGAGYSARYGGYAYPCNASLPDFILAVGSYTARVPGQHVNYGPVTAGSRLCYGGIQANTGMGFSILGDIFLKSQFVVFDGSEPPSMALAPKPVSALGLPMQEGSNGTSYPMFGSKGAQLVQ